MSELEGLLAILVAGLTSANAWQYYQKKAQLKIDFAKEEKKEKMQYQNKLAEEVDELKKKLSNIYDQREAELREMNERILDLSKEVASMKVKIVFLEQENQALKGM
tara:strand:+ start:1180 stop:1497 length:318 start_codon:yes stop_codon:yes gene_type:complete